MGLEQPICKTKSFRIDGTLYVQLPVRIKAEQPAQGEGAYSAIVFPIFDLVGYADNTA